VDGGLGGVRGGLQRVPRTRRGNSNTRAIQDVGPVLCRSPSTRCPVNAGPARAVGPFAWSTAAPRTTPPGCPDRPRPPSALSYAPQNHTNLIAQIAIAAPIDPGKTQIRGLLISVSTHLTPVVTTSAESVHPPSRTASTRLRTSRSWRHGGARSVFARLLLRVGAGTRLRRRGHARVRSLLESADRGPPAPRFRIRPRRRPRRRTSTPPLLRAGGRARLSWATKASSQSSGYTRLGRAASLATHGCDSARRPTGPALGNQRARVAATQPLLAHCLAGTRNSSGSISHRSPETYARCHEFGE
jgi:hypothetical protein